MVYQLADLLQLMRCLRDPEFGCDWDIKQNFDSIVPSTIEEAYELAQTIADKDYEHMREELGDLLFQVVFYSQLAYEHLNFDFNDVVHELTSKLVRRHPHVFPDGSLSSFGNKLDKTEEEIKQSWEVIKQAEREAKQQDSVFDDVPLALPALSRAQKIQKRCANVGFDWPDSEGVWGKLEEEIEELRYALDHQDASCVEHEIGDALFCLVNLARHQGLDAEACMRKANQRFMRRFEFVEQQISLSEGNLKEATLDRMNQLWDEGKKSGL